MSTMLFHTEVSEMVTEPFYEDMVIDTPEAEANLTELVENGASWKRGKARFRDADEEFVRRLVEKYNHKQ